MDELKTAGVGCSVHWRPLHLHPYYEETFGWRADGACPTATRTWERLISLPIFPGHAAGGDRSRRRDGARTLPGELGRLPPRGGDAVLSPESSERRTAAPGCRAPSRRRSRSSGSSPRAPSSPLAAAAVVVSSGFPVFFRQPRVGRGARPFTPGQAAHDAPVPGRPGGHGARRRPRSPRSADFCAGRSSTSCPSSGTSCGARCRSSVPGRRWRDTSTRSDPLWQEVLRARPGLTDPDDPDACATKRCSWPASTGDRERYYRGDPSAAEASRLRRISSPPDVEKRSWCDLAHNTGRLTSRMSRRRDCLEILSRSLELRGELRLILVRSESNDSLLRRGAEERDVPRAGCGGRSSVARSHRRSPSAGMRRPGSIRSVNVKAIQPGSDAGTPVPARHRDAHRRLLCSRTSSASSSPFPTRRSAHALQQLPYVVLVQFGALLLAGVYSFIWRYVGMGEVKAFLYAGIWSGLVLAMLRFGLPASFGGWRVPLSVILMGTILAFGGVLGLRVLRRHFYEVSQRRERVVGRRERPGADLDAARRRRPGRAFSRRARSRAAATSTWT